MTVQWYPLLSHDTGSVIEVLAFGSEYPPFISKRAETVLQHGKRVLQTVIVDVDCPPFPWTLLYL